jgi:hypothetical protein
MPLDKVDLTQYMNPVFIETGTFDGAGVKQALKAGFKKVYSMDVNARKIQRVSQKLSDHTHSGRLHLYLGPSTEVLLRVLPNLKTGVTFWLDAHPDGPLSLDGGNCPLRHELAIIAKHIQHLPYSVVLIDDLRLFSADDKVRLKSLLYDMNPHAELVHHDGVVGDDILGARL